MIIAIDGPAGSGKSAVAKQLAADLGFAYLDTGAMYRAVACRALDLQVNLDDTSALAHIASHEPIAFAYNDGSSSPSQVFIGGIDVTSQIRSAQTEVVVSQVAAVAAVREALVTQQRQIGLLRDTVIEGRDIGTVVFPHAEVKVFLTASAEVRAARRLAQNRLRQNQDQQAAQGTTAPASHKHPVAQTTAAAPSHPFDQQQTLEQIMRRDRLDSERAVSPLTQASDSIVIDTDSLSIRQVCARIAELVRRERSVVDEPPSTANQTNARATHISQPPSVHPPDNG
ncbi:MAG: (d)CMP kinase [Coriobacteriales bacterium]|jgi:cytidylate kinase|nr:(d)CMP kinase [Coriobacteriales bacterium]